MRDVQVSAAALELGQQAKIALHQAGFGRDRHAAQAEPEGERAGVHRASPGHARVFGVLDHRQPGTRRGGQRLVHDGFPQDRLAVIGDRDRARGLERAVFGKRFAHAAARGGGNGKDARTRVALRTLHPAGGLHRVVDRNRVGHGADGGESTCRSRRGPGGNGLLVALARLAQVDVDIDQARGDHQALGLDDLRLCLFGRSRQFTWGLNRSHPAVLEQDIAVRVDPGGRIDQVAAANEDGAQAPPRFFFAALTKAAGSEAAAPGRDAISAMRMATPLLHLLERSPTAARRPPRS